MSFYILFALGAKSQGNSAYENWQWFWDPITYLKNHTAIGSQGGAQKLYWLLDY